MPFRSASAGWWAAASSFAVLGEAVSLAHGATAVAFASYGLTFFPGHSQAWLRHLLISLATFFIHTFSSDFRAAVVFILFLAASILFEFFYGSLVRGHFFQRRYQDTGKIIFFK